MWFLCPRKWVNFLLEILKFPWNRFVLVYTISPFLAYRSHYRYINSPVANKRVTTRFPKNLLYPIDHFLTKSAAAHEIIDNFVHVQSLHLQLNITPVQSQFNRDAHTFLPEWKFSESQLFSNKLAEYRSWNTVRKSSCWWIPESEDSPNLTLYCKRCSNAQSLSQKRVLQTVWL